MRREIFKWWSSNLGKDMEILHTKGIPHELDLWGHDMPHDWPTWHQMLRHFLDTKF